MQGTLQVRPCKLGRRIHAAHAPARPTRPAFDSFRWPPATEKRKKSNSGSRASLARSGAWLRSTKGTAGPKKKDAAKAASFFFSISSSVHKCSCPPSPGNCRGWDGLGWRGCERHGWRSQASRDGFTASPDNPPRPARLTATQSRFGFQPTSSRLYQALAPARRRRTTARQRGASTSSPIGQLTPVPPIPQ